MDRGIRRNGSAGLKRAANAILRSAADGPAAELPYFCECDDPACLRAVWLTAAEYDRLQAEPGGRLEAEHAVERARDYATRR